jgi:hypothetical protein
MRHILLAPLYFLVVTPIGWILRVVHDPLHRAWDPKAESYLTAPRPRGRAVRPSEPVR